MQTKLEAMQRQAKEHQVLPTHYQLGEKHGMDAVSAFPEGTNHATILIFHVCVSDLWKNKFFLFKKFFLYIPFHMQFGGKRTK